MLISGAMYNRNAGRATAYLSPHTAERDHVLHHLQLGGDGSGMQCFIRITEADCLAWLEEMRQTRIGKKKPVLAYDERTSAKGL